MSYACDYKNAFFSRKEKKNRDNMPIGEGASCIYTCVAVCNEQTKSTYSINPLFPDRADPDQTPHNVASDPGL